MADEKPALPPKPDSTTTESSTEVPAKEKEFDDVFARARQTIKPIINREAANEVVSEDLLNFRMKASTPQR